MSNYVIEQIKKHKLITDYLSSKGIEPVGREVNGRLRYLCPLHSERSPSFNVYLNGDIQNFYCFGCKAKYHIVHLYRDLENVSTGDAIKALSGDLDLNISSEIAHAIHDIETDTSLSAEYTPPQIALIVGRQLYDFLERVNKDPVCLAAVEKVELLVDKALQESDFATLKGFYENLPDTLLRAIDLYDERQEKKMELANGQE